MTNPSDEEVFLLNNHRKNTKIKALSSKFWRQIADSSFLGLRNQMVMYITTSKLNSTFGTIGKAMGIKMTAKAVGKNSSSRFSVKNN